MKKKIVIQKRIDELKEQMSALLEKLEGELNKNIFKRDNQYLMFIRAEEKKVKIKLTELEWVLDEGK